jgi:hypothetical protein
MDASGALLSSFIFSFILIPFQEYLGMPTKSIFILSLIAFGLFFYSYSCYKLVSTGFKWYIKLLIRLNSLYVLFSVASVIYYFNQLTILGISYFLIEITFISALLYLEILVFLHLKKSRF